MTAAGSRVFAWLVHGYTALGAGIGFLTILAISGERPIVALSLMVLSVFIDATDGYLARLADVKHHAPRVDGALLDNLIDFLNYVVTPAYFLVSFDMLPASSAIAVGLLIMTVSSYQFSQVDAKTPDHYFKGFPCYWNVAVFYFVIFETSTTFNLVTLVILAILVFIPIKYVYPSRLKYLSPSQAVIAAFQVATLAWAGCCLYALYFHPDFGSVIKAILLGYPLLYLGVSLYRTAVPSSLSRALG